MSYQLMTFRHPHIVFFILLSDKSAFMYTGSRHYLDNTPGLAKLASSAIFIHIVKQN